MVYQKCVTHQCAVIITTFCSVEHLILHLHHLHSWHYELELFLSHSFCAINVIRYDRAKYNCSVITKSTVIYYIHIIFLVIPSDWQRC